MVQKTQKVCIGTLQAHYILFEYQYHRVTRWPGCHKTIKSESQIYIICVCIVMMEDGVDNTVHKQYISAQLLLSTLSASVIGCYDRQFKVNLT